MKKKNPWVAAILNFFLPGIGFAYLGSPVLVVWGISYLVFSLVTEIMIHKQFMAVAVAKPIFLLFAALADFSWAAITFALTKIYNKTIPIQGESS